MTHIVPPASSSLKPLFITAGTCAAVVILYGVVGRLDAPLLSLLVTFAPLGAALNWIRADARAQRVPTVHDFGLFLVVAWPIVIPWYVIRTRGRHAWPLALVVMVAIGLPAIIQIGFVVLDALPWWSR